MLKTTIRRTGKIHAVDDAGNLYVIIVYTESSTFTPSGGKLPIAVPDGSKIYKLETGEPVRRLSDTEFETRIGRSRIKLHVRPKGKI
jgi:hypothetical protein